MLIILAARPGCRAARSRNCLAQSANFLARSADSLAIFRNFLARSANVLATFRNFLAQFCAAGAATRVAPTVPRHASLKSQCDLELSQVVHEWDDLGENRLRDARAAGFAGREAAEGSHIYLSSRSLYCEPWLGGPGPATSPKVAHFSARDSPDRLYAVLGGPPVEDFLTHPMSGSTYHADIFWVLCQPHV